MEARAYIILVNYVASGGNVEEAFFSSTKLSIVCHGYWQIGHMHPDGWSMRSQHRGFVFGMIIFVWSK